MIMDAEQQSPLRASQEKVLTTSSSTTTTTRRIVYTSSMPSNSSRKRSRELSPQGNETNTSRQVGAGREPARVGGETVSGERRQFWQSSSKRDCLPTSRKAHSSDQTTANEPLGGSHGDLLERHQEELAGGNHDINIYNCGHNNQTSDYKVRLLMSPQAAKLAGRQTGNDDLRRSEEADCQRNYHHYDYFTDSELNSSQLNGNYDGENILLFATEHASQLNNHNNHIAKQYARSPIRPNQANYRVVNNPTSNVGRFVNCYPSWRQTHSPASGSHHQNYSFHVPLAGQLGGSRQNLSQRSAGSNNRLLYQARYGFVKPSGGERPQTELGSPRTSSRGFRQPPPFKSRTIGHIPNLVGMSVEDSKAAQSGYLAAEEQANNYEDFYEKAPAKPFDLAACELAAAKQFVVSEGNLLRTSIARRPVCEIRKSIVLDDGQDNPFRPDTELSWEADLMVRLMRRGYPIEELPVLVQTAKEVAMERSSSRTELAPRSHSGKESSRTPAIRRQRSIGELSSGKQVWASSLSRTKSMPKFSSPLARQLSAELNTQEPAKRPAQSQKSNTQANGSDSDSIDKLITSIEDEMSELLRLESSRKEQQEEGLERDNSSGSSKKHKGNLIPIGKAIKNSSTRTSSAASEKTIKSIKKQNKTNSQRGLEQAGGAAKSRLLLAQSGSQSAAGESKQEQQGGPIRSRPTRTARQKVLSADSDLSSSGAVKRKRGGNGCCAIQ